MECNFDLGVLMAKKRIKGAQILIEALIKEGVTDIFGYPGGQVVDIYNELYKKRKVIKHYLTANEQGAAHAADGYARVTGKVGVVLATSGPGATNLVTGIANAMLDSVPIVAITGNVPTYMIGKDSFQEINIYGITMPITKHNYFVTDVSELAYTVHEAFSVARSGRPGPVLIDIPRDIQEALYSFDPENDTVISDMKPSDSDDFLIKKAAHEINISKHPVIIVGGGAAKTDLTYEIEMLSELSGAYITCTMPGLSVIPSYYDKYLGLQGANGNYEANCIISNSDMIIGIGVRFSDKSALFMKSENENKKIIHLDIDNAEINKNIIADIGIVGDLKNVLSELNKNIVPRHDIDTGHVDKKVLKNAAPDPEARCTPENVFLLLNKYKSDRDMIVTDVGEHQIWAARNLCFSRPNTFLSSCGLGEMGYGIGASIGAHVGNGEKPILITGDGSFGMSLQEMATVVTYNIPVLILLFNNNSLGLVRQQQKYLFKEKYYATILDRKTDFVKLAEAFGVNGARVERISDLETIISENIKSNKPFFVDIMTDIEEGI